MITQIGFLRKGDVFRFEGDIYKVGHLLESTNGYVSCIDVNTGKKKRLHIDVDVEIEQANWNLLKGVKQSEVFKQEEIQQTHWRFWGITGKGQGTQKDKRKPRKRVRG